MRATKRVKCHEGKTYEKQLGHLFCSVQSGEAEGRIHGENRQKLEYSSAQMSASTSLQ